MIASPTQPPLPPTPENQPNTPEIQPFFPSNPTANCPLPTTLPTLSNFESELLGAFIIYRYDLMLLADRQKLHPDQLLAFIESPAVQAHLATLRTFAEISYSLLSMELRTSAAKTLEKVAQKSDTLIEQRRAAASILRGLNPPGGTGHSRARQPATPSPLHDSGPRTKDPGLSPSNPALNTQSSPSSTPLPLASPSSQISDQDTANLLLTTIREPRDPHNVATLRAFSMPTATFAGIPIPTDPTLFARRAADFLIDPRFPRIEHAALSRAHRPSTPTRSYFNYELKSINGPFIRFSLELARTTTTHPWLLNSLTPGKENFPTEAPP